MMKYYLYDVWKKEYAGKKEYEKFLTFLWDYKDNKATLQSLRKKWGNYEDIDSGNVAPRFYRDLCDFLNAQEQKLEGTDFLKGKFKYAFNENEKPYGIAVYDGDSKAPFTYLKSDQLGFSAPSTKLNHIYDKYLIGKTKKEKIEKISAWIINAGTLGGSFLWPMEYSENSEKKLKWDENPKYNVRRGGTEKRGTYIKDRADLTLMEIKNYLSFPIEDREKKYKEKYRDSAPCKGKIYQVLYNPLYSKAETNMKRWLDHFRCFKAFVDFFCFKSFMEEGTYEIQILAGVDENIYEMDNDKIGKMLDDLSKMIENRTKEMEEIVKNRRDSKP